MVTLLYICNQLFLAFALLLCSWALFRLSAYARLVEGTLQENINIDLHDTVYGLDVFAGHRNLRTNHSVQDHDLLPQAGGQSRVSSNDAECFKIKYSNVNVFLSANNLAKNMFVALALTPIMKVRFCS